MTFKRLTLALSVSPQLGPADVAQAARDGFRAIINNRPDGEEAGQISAAEMEGMAAAHGMAFAHVPAVSGQIRDEDVASMAAALATLDAQVLAYCRTGTRSTTLWALSQAAETKADDILSAAKEAGYDLTSITSRLAPRVDGVTA